MILRNTDSQPILIGPLLATSDGTPQTTGADIAVRRDGIDVGSPGGTLSHVDSGVWQYIPTQEETDCAILGLILTKADSIAVPLNVPTTRIPIQTIEPKKELSDFGSATTTTANAAGITYPARIQNLIDGPLDAILNDFRQLRVWDEHARRVSFDPVRFRLTYQELNRNFEPEVYDGQNNVVPSSKVSFDYRCGTFTVDGDDGNQDYFVTYEFNLFPAEDLHQLLNLCLHEINSTAEQGTHLTYFSSIDQAPQIYDGPLVVGTAAKAFRRLQTNGTLWANFLIWQDGQSGQQIASEAATYYQTLYDDLRRSVKRAHYLTGPTGAYDLFRNTGFGGINPYSGKWRGLRVNRMSIY